MGLTQSKDHLASARLDGQGYVVLGAGGGGGGGLGDATCEALAGHLPQLIWFEGHNHVSTVHSLGLGRDPVGMALRDFAMRHVKRSKQGSRPAASAD